MSNGKLTPTSYVVLGLVALLGRATSYDMKRMAGISIGHFWSFPHSQLYAEPERLAAMGLLKEDRELGGRRRRRYTITEGGREAFRQWLSDPATEVPELRDPGMLKLFFGNLGSPEDVRKLAESQVALYREKLEEYESLQRQFADVTGLETQLATLDMGFAVTRGGLAFWEGILANPPVRP